MLRPLVLSIVLALVSLPAAAQSWVSGRLMDSRDGGPVARGSVVLLTDGGRFQREVQTDSLGVFWFDGVTPGRFRLRASRVGYNTAQSGYLNLSHNDTVVVDIRVSVTEVLLDPVTVVARSAPRSSAMLRGFYDRKERGMGRYLTRDHIQARNASVVSDLLLTIPGVRSGGWQPGGRQLFFSRAIRSGPGGCPVQFFVDNVHVNRTSGVAALGSSRLAARDTIGMSQGSDPFQPSIDEIVDPQAVEGIEVYPGLGSVPAEFSSPEARCGTVVIWTRRGYQD
ncbi:carboxypeptidase regulatory-like domain-containing protein [Longimicrobium terrae]|uniref:TonB-dependent receptor plug domain-containing protein n=1 Tax=Longimicrobium terrae TaxID=1639882 RepID=A0A841GY11_9BACT|nr:carboxypeptidase regulatory-like domain-containing protein [Longimicrobium terrae]MBB4636250.1 hypothetical protein [Longimicrobium terrae]MBB6070645.1 hypothetical protein [Longimicrobium terrae]NNC29629.1 TonB-dependent receptor [Longimicrobium terrae]